MKPMNRLAPAALFSALIAWGVAAQTNPTLKDADPVWKQMKAMVAQGQSQQAYQLGQFHQDDLEGTPDFDFFYGMAAIDTGRIAEGTFALERVLYSNPKFQTARLELARAYYMLGQYPLARRHFQTVLDVSPPVSVIQRINAFMRLIDQAERQQQARWLAFAEVAGGYDDNVNYATANETFNSPTLGQGTLAKDGRAQSDWYNDAKAGVGYYYPLDRKTTLYGRVDLSDHNIVSSHAFDTFTYTMQAGVIHKLDGDNTLSGQWIHQQHSVDGARYREMNGLAGNWMRVLDRKSSVQLGGSYLNLVYNDLDNKDAEEYNFSIGYNRQVPLFGQSLIQARFSFGYDEPNSNSDIAKATTEKDFYGFSLAHKVPLPKDVLLTSTLSYLNSEYGSRDLLFGKTRQDDLLNLEVKADWRWDKHWQLSLSSGWRDQNSNIEIYDYDRSFVRMGVRYEYY